MNKFFLSLIVVFFLLPVMFSKSADNAFRDFQKNEQKEFQDFKTGKKAAPVKSPVKPETMKKQAESGTSYSGYKTYVLPPVVKNPEDQKAWELYRSYLQINKAIAASEKEIKRIENIGADSATFRTWRWLASKEEAAKHDRLVEELPKIQKELAGIKAEWEKTYSGYYGPLSDSERSISVNYLDPNDKNWPQKMQTIEMDRMEFRLRSFPFSQRGGGESPVTAEAPPVKEEPVPPDTSLTGKKPPQTDTNGTDVS